MNNIIFFIFHLLCIYYLSISQTLIINNESYSNDEISFIKYKDRITFLTDTIAVARFSETGFLKIIFNLSIPEKIMLPLYYYESHLFLEPEKEYTILIPDKKYLSIEDSLNPYFTPKIVYPIVQNNNFSLQNCISNFEDDYYNLIASNYAQLKYKAQKSKIDSLCNLLINKYKNCTTNYFKEYAFYKIAQLKFLTYEKNINYLIKKYFNDKKILYNNEAYWELFNDIFSDYFSLITNERWAQNLNLIINRTKSHTELKQMFKNNPAFTNDTLIELVILKGLHDIIFGNKTLSNNNNFSKLAITTILDSLKNFGINEYIKLYASNIIYKIKSDSLRDLISELPFYSFDDETYYLRNFIGNYIYVAIYDFRAYNFILDMKQIKAFLSNFEKKLKIIILVTNCNKNKLITTIEKEKLIGNFYIIKNEKELKNKYKITLPSFFFIYPDGKINKNVAIPDENFKKRLLKIIGE